MIPEHYARDIAQRCESLINTLMPVVQGGLSVDTRFGGPLGTTFLLALGAPMVILPIERIFKPGRRGTLGDERIIDPMLAQSVADVLGKGKTFGEAPFGRENTWSYIPNHAWFDIVGSWPLNEHYIT